jgi:hypothetical protein
MPRNVYAFRNVLALTHMLKLACRNCGRRGHLRTARLFRDYGPDKPMPDRILLARQQFHGIMAQTHQAMESST